MKPPTVKMSDAMRDAEMTIHVDVVRDWRWRLGLWLMMLGARVMRARLKEGA
jgi:hypothetical protein